MPSIRDIAEIDRPREKLARKGPGALSDKELIAAIIGRGTRGRDVFAVAADIAKVLEKKGTRISYGDLMEIEGVGTTKACQVVAAIELARRYFSQDVVRIANAADVVPLVTELFDKKQEYFLCLTLNGAGELITKRVITVGLLNHSPVHPREVYADAITDRAASVIFVHNHPSGNPEPSVQDVAITTQLGEAGELLGIRVLDHIVVTKKGYVSLKERGMI